MKKRIGNLRGKPIIEGDKNLMTPNELHIDSLGKSDNEGGGSDIEVEPVYYFKYDQSFMPSEILASYLKVYDKTKQKYYSVARHSLTVPPGEIFGVICPRYIYLDGIQTTVLDFFTAYTITQNPSMSLLDAKKAIEDLINLYRITKEEYYEGIEILTAEQILDMMPKN